MYEWGQQSHKSKTVHPHKLATVGQSNCDLVTDAGKGLLTFSSNAAVFGITALKPGVFVPYTNVALL